MKFTILVVSLFLAVVSVWAAERGVVVPEHTLQAPYLFGRTTSIENWEYGGSAVATESFIRLTPAIRGRSGWLWNTKPVMARAWEVTIDFKIHNTRSPGADGMAFWYTKETQKPGSVFGNQEDFVGFGLIFDTYDNDGKRDSPKILATVGDGTQKWDHDRDGEGNKIGSCLASIRNRPHIIKARISYEDKTLQVFVDAENKGEFTQCFVAHNVDLPTGYHFGMSAGTGGLADYHDVYSIVTRSLESAPAAAATPAIPEPRESRYQRMMRNRLGRDRPRDQQDPAAPATDAESQQFMEKFRNRINTVAEPQQPQTGMDPNVQPVQPPNVVPTTNTVADAQLRSKVDNIISALDMLAPLIANAATKKDLTQLQNTVAESVTRTENSQAIGQLRDEVAKSVASISNQQKTDMDRILAQVSNLGEKFRLLQENIERLSNEQGTYTRVMNKQAQELSNTIKKETSFGFWTYFIVFQVVFLIGYIFFAKYNREKSKLF